MRNRGFDGWRWWWRDIVNANLPVREYGTTGIDTQVAQELHRRLPHLDYDTLYRLVCALHEECYK